MQSIDIQDGPVGNQDSEEVKKEVKSKFRLVRGPGYRTSKVTLVEVI